MKKNVFLLIKLIVLLMIFPFSVHSASLFSNERKAVKTAVVLLVHNLPGGNLEVSIGSLNIKGTKLSSPFAVDFMDSIQNEISNEKYKDEFVTVKKRVITRSLFLMERWARTSRRWT